MKPRALAVIVAFGILTWLYLPLPLFIIGAAVISIVGSLTTAAYWYEQAIRVEAERIHLVFEVEGKSIDLAAMTSDYESTLDRLSEVLDEHALCPAPVSPVPMTFAEHTAKALELISEPIIVEASNVSHFPTQRKGGKA